MVVSVLVEIKFKQKDKTFDYLVPSNLEKNIKIGKRVLVPFSNKKLEGFIIGIKNESTFDLKEICEVIDEDPVLNEELLELGKTISHDNVCNLISVYQTMLPKAYKAKIKSNVNIKTVSYIKLVDRDKAIEFLNTSKAIKQKEIISDLLNNDEIKKSIYSSSIVKSLLDKKLIEVIEKEEYRINEIKEKKELIVLNEEQEKAKKQIEESNKDVILLHGVTGSGKTEVYMHLINNVIKQGKEAIMLVPEISLTPQMINRFRYHFSDDIAVFHSGLSDGEKYDEYRKIKRGEVKIVIGARSAIFVPFSNIGIIIIDEEHSSVYKQDHNPRYNAIDVAIIRAKYHNAKVVVASATPSIETYARSLKGYYELVTIKNRANNMVMPSVSIVDMKNEIRRGNSIFSKVLIDKIKDRLENNEQVLLFLNKRGYSNYLMCSNCGEVYKCPNCDITLTYHKTSGMNRCHYCGYAKVKDDNCPSCKTPNLKTFGMGTEKIEEEIKKLFESARVVRMDIDTTTKKGAHEKIINSFSNHEYDILIGTQMISKGLDFPLCTLVGIISADTILNLPDFRSSERTFQLINQISGRAGRKDKYGEVILQTFNPDNYSILFAKNHDYVGFYNEEMKIRKQLKYPPYYFISIVRVNGKDFNETFNETKKISNYIKSNISKDMIVLGPSVSSSIRINKSYYFEIIIKYRDKEKIIELLNDVVTFEENNTKFTVNVDVNAISM